MEAKEKIIVALDVPTPDKAIFLVKSLAPHVGLFKIGLEFINSMLASLIVPAGEKEAVANLKKIRELFTLIAGKIFWDSKFADTPNTVVGAVKAIANLNPRMLSIHASINRESFVKAVANKGNSLVLGVTVLTSIDKDECIFIFGAEPMLKVLKFAEMLVEVSADGIICSPRELISLGKQKKLNSLLKVTPGIRCFADSPPDDQKRTMTAKEAILAGANYLVIGRPITHANNPVEAAKKFVAEIKQALAEKEKGGC